MKPKKIALLFPGQGSQEIKMGEDLYQRFLSSSLAESNLLELFWAEELRKIAWRGLPEVLNQTLYAQPALLGVSVLALELFRLYTNKNKEFLTACVAGHSLGEFSALYAAGYLGAKEVTFLVNQRAKLMQKSNQGSMAAVINFDLEKLKEICRTSQVVIANYNSPQQQVISGETESLKEVLGKLKALKAKVVLLKVSGAFHSPLMKEAGAKFADLIEKTNFSSFDHQVPIVQNFTGQATFDPKEIKANLKAQMTSPVRWTKSIETMINLGVEVFIEFGSKNILAGLIKKFDRNLVTANVSNLETLQKTLDLLKEN